MVTVYLATERAHARNQVIDVALRSHYDYPRVVICERLVMPLHAPQRFATRIPLIRCSLSLLLVPRGIINAFCNRPTVNEPYWNVSSYLPPPFFLPSILHPSSLLYPSPVRSRSPNYPTPLRNRYLRFSWKRLPTFLQILRIPRNDYSFSLSPLWKKQRCYLALFIEFKREARK